MKQSEHREQIGPFLYRWGPGCFPVTADSLALGEFVTLRPRDKVLDLGCGAGLLLLTCAERCPNAVLSGVELDRDAIGWALENLSGNGLVGQILAGDVRTVRLPEPVDVVITNPPWYRKGAGADAGRAKTEDCPLNEWCAAAALALRDGGRLALAHSPARLVELFAALTAVGLEPKRLQFLQQREDTPPFAVLLEAILRGRPGLSVLSTCVQDKRVL